MSDDVEARARAIIAADPEVARMVAKITAEAGAVGLTTRQRGAFDFIKAFHAEHGQMPSFEEIRVGAGFCSKSSVSNVVTALVERGVITRMAGRARAMAFVGGQHEPA